MSVVAPSAAPMPSLGNHFECLVVLTGSYLSSPAPRRHCLQEGANSLIFTWTSTPGREKTASKEPPPVLRFLSHIEHLRGSPRGREDQRRGGLDQALNPRLREPEASRSLPAGMSTAGSSRLWCGTYRDGIPVDSAGPGAGKLFPPPPGLHRGEDSNCGGLLLGSSSVLPFRGAFRAAFYQLLHEAPDFVHRWPSARVTGFDLSSEHFFQAYQKGHVVGANPRVCKEFIQQRIKGIHRKRSE